MAHSMSDAILVGSGPNGLVAAIVLARAGLSVQVYEARETLGGGLCSLPLTLPGFVHDVCAAVFPMAVISPILRELALEEHGVKWLYPPVSLAHPLADGTAAALLPSLGETAASLGIDGAAYRRLFEPLVAVQQQLWPELLAPLHLPRHPLTLVRFGLPALRSAKGLARAHFRGAHAQALFAGCAAHGFLPLSKLSTAAMGLALAVAGHAPGWPYPQGGAQVLADALVAYARRLGVTFVTGCRVASLDQLPAARAYLLDVSPRQLAEIAGERLPARYRSRLLRYRYGPAAYKVDWALSAPIPWRAAACRAASTVHVGGTLEEIADAEAAIWAGRLPQKPFILVAQPTIVDPSRAPPQRHTGWAYAHVPMGWSTDITALIEARIEEYAPGFRETILARHVFTPAALEQHNPNYLGGHIIGGVADLTQLFTRPVARWVPYSTPNPAIFICSASTPPGAGVHGMCGYHAAQAVLRRRFSRRVAPP
jgi:phytoene dehydrogenase-like protein